ncbi:zinc-binding dehydrogenase [Echria macrotheca]|uniref:Zinc-binding dehydrogenase n=1 Tax=Echria macrotheca TaxID=438768 RepID=A0AAJ0B5B9_9PEZI|nr:zinc-binding dehydrogenase [Echria macrotheca]
MASSTPSTIRKTVISTIVTSNTDTSNIFVVSAPPPPPPSRKEAQVRILYSGFNGADVNMAHGRYPFQRKPPFTPGYCFVGVVVSLGSATSAVQPGDTVTGVTTYDAQAELANFALNLLVKVPAVLARDDKLLQQVTALSLDWNTAYGLVHQCANVQAGQKVFIHGLSGAVGQGLLAFSLLRGADVYGTASERNHAALAKQGVKAAYDYRNKNWIEASKNIGGMDVVFDALGFESWDESYQILSEKGLLVGYGGNQSALNGEEANRSQVPYFAKLWAKGLLSSTFGGKRTAFYYISPGSASYHEGLTTLMGMLAEGKIEVPIKAVWNLTTEGLREAHSSWGKSRGMGSLLIRIRGVE